LANKRRKLVLTHDYDGYDPFLKGVLYGTEMQDMFRSVGLVAARTRWLAILAGCVAGITGALSVSLFFPIVPSLLILGAIAQHRFHRFGFWLMVVGALFLSLWVLPIGAIVLLGSLRTLHLYRDFNIVAGILGWTGSFLLLAGCDTALMIESRKLRIF